MMNDGENATLIKGRKHGGETYPRDCLRRLGTQNESDEIIIRGRHARIRLDAGGPRVIPNVLEILRNVLGAVCKQFALAPKLVHTLHSKRVIALERVPEENDMDNICEFSGIRPKGCVPGGTGKVGVETVLHPQPVDRLMPVAIDEPRVTTRQLASTPGCPCVHVGHCSAALDIAVQAPLHLREPDVSTPVSVAHMAAVLGFSRGLLREIAHGCPARAAHVQDPHEHLNGGALPPDPRNAVPHADVDVSRSHENHHDEQEQHRHRRESHVVRRGR